MTVASVAYHMHHDKMIKHPSFPEKSKNFIEPKIVLVSPKRSCNPVQHGLMVPAQGRGGGGPGVFTFVGE
jgi:hypothetical protein